ncbi:unnamed protein product [Rotaria sordida]|nr:unnamed protein product [Rotaria sordida]CAF1089105.1 unnamed protein product [Rotaria sordida]
MHNNNGSKCSSGTSTKLIKSFYEWESLSTSLQQHIIEAKNSLKDGGLFNMCSSPENALRDLRRKLSSFVWTQTFRVNKTLRSKNVHSLYLFRYFIFDLCESLAQGRHSHSTPISAYRGTILHRDKVEQLHVGALVSTNSFLSSSRFPEVALSFISSDQGVDTQTNRNRNNPEQFVLFKIDIDINQSHDVVVADISNES